MSPGIRSTLRRLVLRVARPLTVEQQQSERRLLEAVQALDRTKVEETAIDDLRRWLHNNDVRLRSLERAAEELGDLVRPAAAFTAAARSAPDPQAIGLERYDAGSSGRVIGYRDGRGGVQASNDYVAFEDVFRLSEDVIRERQRAYLPLVEDRTPVLDAGCGRGEFLELLRDAGIPARGVDLDPGMVERARAKGLEVELGDAVGHLESLPDESLGTIFAAQVVEHLPVERLLAFLGSAPAS